MIVIGLLSDKSEGELFWEYDNTNILYEYSDTKTIITTINMKMPKIIVV